MGRFFCEKTLGSFRLRSTTVNLTNYVQTRLIASLPSKTHLLYFLYRRCTATSVPSGFPSQLQRRCSATSVRLGNIPTELCTDAINRVSTQQAPNRKTSEQDFGIYTIFFGIYFSPTVKTVGYWFLLTIARDYQTANGFSIADGFNRRLTGFWDIHDFFWHIF